MAKTEKKKIEYQFHRVLPFPTFKGARQMVRSTIKKSFGNWKPEFWLPIPMAKTIEELDKLCIKLYNLTLIQLLGKGVRQNHYDIDIPLKKWYNDQMTKTKDVPNCTVPDTKWWLYVTKPKKASEIKEYQEMQANHGLTHEQTMAIWNDPDKLMEHAKQMKSKLRKQTK